MGDALMGGGAMVRQHRSPGRAQPARLDRRHCQALEAGPLTMLTSALLDLPKANHQQIIQYLLPSRSRHEEAAFIFARADESGVFTPVEAYLVPPTGFVHRSPYYLELT